MLMKIRRSDILSRCSVSILITSILLTGADALLGAAVTWEPASNITGDSDVLNTGSTVWAYCWSIHSTTVNSVSFAAITATSNQDFSVSGNYSPPYLLYTDFTSGSGAFSLLSSNSMNLLSGAWFSPEETTMQVTLANLSIGHNYAVQVWVNDPRGPYNSRTETVSSAGGNAVTLKFSTQSGTTPGGPGEFTIGTFTADATNQVFTMYGFISSESNPQYVAQVNAMQMRDLATQTLPVWVAINPAGPGAMQLIFEGTAGANYTLLTTTNLTTPLTNWTPLANGTGLFSANNTTNLDTSATNEARFYIIRSP